MNRVVSIFQIGDIHFEDFKKAFTHFDNKDSASNPLGGDFARPISPLILRHLAGEFRSSPDAVIAICGDLANRGDLDQFEAAVAFIQSALDASGVIHSSEQLHLVPGNHDVDLSTEMPFVDLSPERFDALSARLPAKSKLKVTTSFRTENWATGASAVQILSVNTARANGAPRLFPGIPVSDGIAQILRDENPGNLFDNSKKLQAKVSGKYNAVELQEVLDIPVILTDSLDQIDENIRKSPSSTLPVLIAHHGFLPQGIPRFGPYTEMINGGQVRRKLMLLGRPVLYLHGHIHQGVVETVAGGYLGAGHVDSEPVISVSAPLLKDGYNRIDVHFQDSGTPVGIEIYSVQVDAATGSIAAFADPVRIPLTGKRRTPKRFMALFQQLVEGGTWRGEDIILTAKKLDSELVEAEIEDFVIDQVWQGSAKAYGLAREPFTTREFTFL